MYALGADPRAAYVAWVDSVKRAGGTTAVAPHITGHPLAARYDVAFVFPNAPDTTLNPLFRELPDDWSNSGLHVYYLAPADVQAYARGGIVTPEAVPGEAPPRMPLWYDDLVKYGKYALYGGGALIAGLVVLNIVSALPRGRR